MAEHIGTKTAVQIRSHAQKFFNKLEKKKEAGEAVEKGGPSGMMSSSCRGGLLPVSPC